MPSGKWPSVRIQLENKRRGPGKESSSTQSCSRFEGPLLPLVFEDIPRDTRVAVASNKAFIPRGFPRNANLEVFRRLTSLWPDQSPSPFVAPTRGPIAPPLSPQTESTGNGAQGTGDKGRDRVRQDDEPRTGQG